MKKLKIFSILAFIAGIYGVCLYFSNLHPQADIWKWGCVLVFAVFALVGVTFYAKSDNTT